MVNERDLLIDVLFKLFTGALEEVVIDRKHGEEFAFADRIEGSDHGLVADILEQEPRRLGENISRYLHWAIEMIASSNPLEDADRSLVMPPATSVGLGQRLRELDRVGFEFAGGH